MLDDDLGLTGDEATGVSIVRTRGWPSRCAGSPRTPARRATSSSPRSASCRPGQGLNAATGEYGDLVAAGVIDPVKVTRSAVEHAASIAAMLLTTETLVVEKHEEHEHAAGGGHGHSHGPGGHTH